MEPVGASSMVINEVKGVSASVGLSYREAFEAIAAQEKALLEVKPTMLTDIAFEVAFTVLYVGAWVSYVPAISLGTSYGYLEYSDPPGRNDTFYPNTSVQLITGASFYMGFVIMAIAIPLFIAYGCRFPRFTCLQNGETSLQSQLCRLKEDLQQKVVFLPREQENSLLPSAQTVEIVPLLSPLHLQKLNFQQLKAWRAHNVSAFQSQLKAHAFAEREEMRWNKIEALLSIPLKEATKKNALQEASSLLEEKVDFDRSGQDLLQAALSNFSNFRYVQDPEVLEVLIHELPLEKGTQTVKILAKHLTVAHALTVLSSEQLILTMHARKCSLKAAEKFCKLAAPLPHDMQFRLSGGEMVSANRQLLAESSPAFKSMLYGKMKGGQSEDLSTPFTQNLPEVDAQALRVVIALLEGKDWQEINCPSDTLCAVAMLADCYDCRALYPLIEELLLASLPTATGEVLQLYLNISQRCPFLKIDAHLDHFLAMRNFAPSHFSAPLTASFVHLLALVIDLNLPKCQVAIKEHFLSYVPSSRLSSDEGWQQRVHLLLGLSKHAESAFKRLCDVLYVWFDCAPMALKMVWDQACREHNLFVQKYIVAACQSHEWRHIWLAHWSTPPVLTPIELKVI